jgi:hypothetical protein
MPKPLKTKARMMKLPTIFTLRVNLASMIIPYDNEYYWVPPGTVFIRDRKSPDFS